MKFLVSAALAMCLCSLNVAAAFAAAPGDEISATDKKILLDYFHERRQGCAACVPAGVDLDTGEIRVKLEDLKKRDDQLAALQAHGKEILEDGNGGDISGNVRFEFHCKLKTKPKVVADISLFKMYESIQGTPPLDDILARVSDMCGNPKNLDNIALAQKFKVIHFKVIAPRKDLDNTYDFDSKAGVFTVGLWQGANDLSGNDTNNLKTFFRKH